MATYTQEHRHIAIYTPLGDDVLLLSKVAGEEAISDLFHFQLDLLSESDSIQPRDIIGKNVTFYIKSRDEEPQYFNGYIKKFTYWGRDDRLSHYRAELVPWLWFLTRRTDSRIFQEKTVPQIVEKVFTDLGFNDFEFRLNGTYETREYCVQYQESDFNFVSRLLEEEGIFYFFKHKNGQHMLLLGDNKGVYEECEENEVEFLSTISGKHESDHLRSWEHCYEFTSGKVAQKDYNFETPADPLLTGTQTLIDLENIDKFELYEFPGKYEDSGAGDKLAERRMEAEEVGYDRVESTGICPSFGPGHTFTVTRHHHPEEEGRSYVLLSVRHEASAMGAYETGEMHEGDPYTNVFTCIPSNVMFRPARRTSEPRISGAQTATVVGPEGEEIYTDEYGRVKLQFHWDRYGKADENSSCWVRVAQEWAGKKWGAIFLPRIGQEVIVTFLDGDPDRPLITGRVYNADNEPPYPLPEHKTISCIKSRSTKDAADEDFNEIRFEDKKGEEQLFIHAQRNLDVRAENDRFETIEHDRHLVVENDKHEHVKNDRHEKVDRHHYELIGDERHLHVKGRESKQVDGSLSLIVKKDVGEEFDGNHSMDVGKDCYIKAANICLEADTNITIKVGGSSIAIDSGGITISTSGQLDIESDTQASVSGAAGLKLESNGQTNIKGALTNVNADGILQVRGSLVKIN